MTDQASRDLTVQTAAYWAGVSPQTVRRWCRAHQLGRRVGGRFLVSRTALMAFMLDGSEYGEIKKERRKQQKQQSRVFIDDQPPYRQGDAIDETAAMLNPSDLPARREPNIETVSASLPYGARERIRAAAAAERLTAGEYLRRTILQAAAPDLLQHGAH